MRGHLMKNPFRVRVNVSEDTVLSFMAKNFDLSKAVLATDDRFESFRSLALHGKAIAAAQEYEKLTGASLEECHLATTFVKSLE
jgi:hypothetical protein